VIFSRTGSPSSSSSSEITTDPIIFYVFLIALVGYTGTGTGSLMILPSSSFFGSSTFGFGAGIPGAFGFPVDVFDDVFEAVTVILALVIEDPVMSLSDALDSSLAMSFSPPGRLTMVTLASFSAFSLVALATSIVFVRVSILVLDSVTTLARDASMVPHAAVYLSKAFVASANSFWETSILASSLAIKALLSLVPEIVFY